MCIANSGGGVDDNGLNFRITSCGIFLSFGSCRLYRNFATVSLFQMIIPMATTTNTVSRNSNTPRTDAAASVFGPLGQMILGSQQILTCVEESQCRHYLNNCIKLLTTISL